MNTSPVCPHCFVYVEDDDMIDCYYDDEYHVSKRVGHCPTCNKKFVWHEIYRFDCIEEFEEEDDNGNG